MGLSKSGLKNQFWIAAKVDTGSKPGVQKKMKKEQIY